MSYKAAPSSDNLLLGKGQVFFDRFDVNGVGTGLKHLGNVETFELTTADTLLDKYSSMSSGAPLYKRVNTRRLVTLKVTGDEFHPENMALVTMGTQSVLVQAATAVVAEALAASTIPGAYYATLQLGPISTVAVKFGIAVGVLGTDYAIVNPAVGVIRILPGTTQTGAVTVDYTPTAYTSTDGPAVIHGGVSGTIEGRVRFIGDPTTGPALLVDVWHATVSPSGAVGLISDAYGTMSLDLAVLDDSANHAASPLYQITYLG